MRFESVRTREGKLMYRIEGAPNYGSPGAISYVFRGISSVDKYEGNMQ